MGMFTKLKHYFWLGLYTNCWTIINLVNRVAEYALSHISKPAVDDGYNQGRYTWKER